jgi:hypothetical protein
MDCGSLSGQSHSVATKSVNDGEPDTPVRLVSSELPDTRTVTRLVHAKFMKGAHSELDAIACLSENAFRCQLDELNPHRSRTDCGIEPPVAARPGDWSTQMESHGAPCLSASLPTKTGVGLAQSMFDAQWVQQFSVLKVSSPTDLDIAATQANAN